MGGEFKQGFVKVAICANSCIQRIKLLIVVVVVVPKGCPLTRDCLLRELGLYNKQLLFYTNSYF